MYTQGTCLKLLHHSESHPVTTMTWISTFQGVATVDASGNLRCFDLHDHLGCNSNHEIVTASSTVKLKKNDNNNNNKSKVHRFQLESFPHHFSAIEFKNASLPNIQVHCLDYI